MILHSKNQKIFYSLFNFINKHQSQFLGKKVVINISSKKIFNLLNNCENKKNDWIGKSFISQKKVFSLALKSKFIISPGGQTMINLIEKNFFVNAYISAKNQLYYANKLKKQKQLNIINFNSLKLKKNKKINYISSYSKKKIMNYIKLENIFF